VAELAVRLGQTLAAWRGAADLNQTELGRRIGYDRTTVAHAERGTQIPAEEFWQACEEQLGAEGALVELHTAWLAAKRERRRAAKARLRAQRQATVRQWIGPIPSTHAAPNDLGQAANQQASVPAVGLGDLRQIATAFHHTPRALDDALVDHFRNQLGICAADDGALGPKKTLPVVLGVVGSIAHSAAEVQPALRRKLLRVGAEGAEFAGWLYRDIGALDLANYWRDRAIEWAQEAGDLPMQGYVLLRKSQTAWDERDGLRMLTLAQAVLEGPWQLPRKVLAEAAQQEARGQAMVTGDLQLMERRLGEAQALLSDDGPDEDRKPDSELGVQYNATRLAIQTAICYGEAGRPQQALDIYQRSLSQDSFSHRDYGYFSSLMAETLAAADEPDEAAKVGVQAQAVAVATNSRRTSQELRRLLDRLTPWADRPTVRELREIVLG
jgi:transcriptional regulator with XRE-family HTH domain